MPGREKPDGLLARLARGVPVDVDREDTLTHTLLARGFVRQEGSRLVLTDLGRSRLGQGRDRPQAADGAGFRIGSADLTDDDGRRRRVPFNLDESPLARLLRVKGRDGRPVLSQAEFEAGERLRAEFTRGQLSPRITMNWSSALPGRGRGSRGAGDLADSALAARRNVERAIDAVGPDLGGLLLDFCCFLKGIETIERERGWPVRSAKVVIGLALRSLARHYGFDQAASGPARGHGLRHWGAEDYRPVLDGGADGGA